MNCKKCNKEIIEHGKAGLCLDCWHESNRGVNAHNWQGGVSRYKTIIIKGKTIPEHRYIWQQAYGQIPEGYVIHHLNGDRKDNRLENLIAIPQGKHLSAHGVSAQWGQDANLRHMEEIHKNKEGYKDERLQ